MRLVVSVPAHKSRIAGVFKKELQLWRLDMAVTEYHISLALVASIGPLGASLKICEAICPLECPIRPINNHPMTAVEAITKCHHIAWTDNFRNTDCWRWQPRVFPNIMSTKTK